MNRNQRILMVVTSHDHIDADHPTGLWLEEFAVPFVSFRRAGMDILVSSPKGGSAPVDPRSKPSGEQEREWREATAALDRTEPLAKVGSEGLDALFLPGGHGTMFDLPGSVPLKKLLETLDAQGRVIAAVCHGPAGLVGAKRADGQPLVAGKRLTAFTNSEERAVELDGLMPFLLESRLRELGADFAPAPNWTDHVEIDGNLITGQNPQSSSSVAQAVIRALSD